jgi:hypothetical protein
LQKGQSTRVLKHTHCASKQASQVTSTGVGTSAMQETSKKFKKSRHTEIYDGIIEGFALQKA